VSAKGKKKQQDQSDRVVCTNRRARFNFEIVDELDCGIVLFGSEVKSIRNNKISIEEAYGRVDNGEVWLIGSDIAEYSHATMYGHERIRKRKLLLHRREIEKFAERAHRDGLTLIPLSVFLQRGKVKVRLGLCKGRKQHDKRERVKKREAQREMRDAQLKR
jgi:SsrA-binding protein